MQPIVANAVLSEGLLGLGTVTGAQKMVLMVMQWSLTTVAKAFVRNLEQG